MARVKNTGTEVVELSKEELLISYFRTLNEQGQDYILKTMDMVKDKYIKNRICFPTWKVQSDMPKEEYEKSLRFCIDHRVLCFEFYRRNPNWREKFKEELKRQNGVIEDARVH